MNFWTADNLRECAGGRWLSEPAAKAESALIAGVTTDSRAVKPGQAFFALEGEKFDGHDFLALAAKAGAALLFVSDAAKAEAAKTGKASIVLVDDTLVALQRLAGAYRDHLRACGTRVIAVVGSNGKTTTRNLIHAVLSSTLSGTQSPKSFNNHIGVPLTILAAGAGSAQPEHAATPRKRTRRAADSPRAQADDFVVVEVGTNHPGEIDALAKIVRPDAVVVTSIGHEHMEFFKTLDGVAIEEASILPHVAPEGLAVIEGEAAMQFERLKLIPDGLKAWTYGASPEAVAAIYDGPVVEGQTQVFTTRGGKLTIRLPLLGVHNANNALAALLIGKWMGLEDDLIAAALGAVTPVEMRMNVSLLGDGESGVLLVNDAYNANPSSVAAALHTAASLQTPSLSGRRVAVLGDMLELGEHGPDLHRMIGKLIAQLTPPNLPDEPRSAESPGFDRVILVGKLAFFIAESLAKSWPAQRIEVYPDWSDDLPQRVAASVRPGDMVLVKASRGMGLERIAKAIEAKFKNE